MKLLQTMFNERPIVDDVVYIKMMMESKYRYTTLFDYDAKHGSTTVNIYKVGKKIFTLGLFEKAKIIDVHGKEIEDAMLYLEYVKRERTDYLYYNHLPAMKLIETENPMDFHGVYYTIKDAENYLLNLGK